MRVAFLCFIIIQYRISVRPFAHGPPLFFTAQKTIRKRAVEAGFTRIVSAGGETSGAVNKGLGFSSCRIGESVAPDVPIMTPAERPDIRLILKSCNFDQEDFFGRVLAMTALQEEK